VISSIPQIARTLKIPLANLKIDRLYILPKPDADVDLLQKAFSEYETWTIEDNGGALLSAMGILSIIFSVIIAIVMFLCFFSLTSSMLANILE
jgi:hypothetical protein